MFAIGTTAAGLLNRRRAKQGSGNRRAPGYEKMQAATGTTQLNLRKDVGGVEYPIFVFGRDNFDDPDTVYWFE